MSEALKGHLVFACGESLYAVPAERAAEVVSLPALTRVPGAPPHLLGVFAHRGEVIPVIDMGVLVGAKGEAANRRAVLVRVAKGSLALTAGRVAGVSMLSGELSPLGTSGVQAHLKGPARASVGEVAVIEPEGMFELLSKGT
jgi:purine-binding chemotaxis protein CheW